MSVEIIGRSVRTPSARNVDELFQLLKDERCVVTSVPQDRWSHARFWHPVAGTPGKAYTFAAGVIEDVVNFIGRAQHAHNLALTERFWGRAL